MNQAEPLPALDHGRMQRALALAALAIGVSDPNPRVGCVIGLGDGRVLGEGSTQAAGQAHAEVMALRAAQAAGRDVRGATAWVSLEPCAHHGRTPPCCDALIAAGIARVVVAAQDPFPQVAGRGLARLRAAGIEVALAGVDLPELADLAEAARELNIGFFHRHETGLPWVRLKVAASLDGRTALADGRSQWITGRAARTDGHAWRRRAAAIVTGVGTVVADDPSLDVRLVPTTLQPLRVVVDSSARMSPSARMLALPHGRTVVATLDVGSDRAQALAYTGAELLACPPDAAGRVDLGALLRLLAQRSVNEVHVEAGARLNASLLRRHQVDELLLYQAPRLLGQGPGIADGAEAALDALGEAPPWRIVEAERLDTDLRLRLRPTKGHCRKT